MERRIFGGTLSVSRVGGIFIILLILQIVITLPAAHANMAANTKITNSAQVSYNDGTGTQTATSSVTVTVSLVPSAPSIALGTDQSTAYTGANTQLTNTFTVTATANGPDAYSLTPTNSSTTNATSSSTTLVSPSSPVTLGATVTVSSCTTTTIYVPSDGTADSSINGIVAGDTVVISSEARTVSSITDNATGTSTIVLSTALSSAPSAGVLVAERKSVSVQVNSGTITTTGTSIVIHNTLTAASTTDSSKTTTSSYTTDTYTNGLLNFSKYVRNVTSAVTGTTSYSWNSNTYYSSGVTAKPGETLEYILVITNAGSGSVTSSVVTDSIPTTYVTLVTGEYSGSTDVTYVNESSTSSYLTSTSDTDAATYVSPTLTVYVGTGATSSTGGTISAAGTVRVLYQVTVK